MQLSVVIPAFNERERIARTIREIDAYLAGAYARYEIIVSDDGSADETCDIVMRLQAQGLPIRLVRGDRNRGKGHAMRRGVAASMGALVLMTDADLATPIDELPRLEERLADGADIAIGSRGLGASRLVVRQPLYRELMGRLFNVLVQLALLPGIHDTQCGFKLFRGPLARRLFAQLSIDRFAFDVEVLGLAARGRCRIAEVPVRWSHMNHSKLSLGRDGVGMFRDLVTIAYRLRTGAYDLEALAAVTAEPAAVSGEG
jgi:dolichyl-phosphate beta-glucosyltransferase